MLKYLMVGIGLSVLAFPIAAQQPAPEKQVQNPPPEQRGTEERPFVVKVLPNPESRDTSKEDKEERDQKRLLDNRLVDRTDDLATYTFLLFIATAALAAITGALVIAGILQSRQAKRATKIAADTLKLTPEIERAYVSGGGFRIVHRRIDTGVVHQQPDETSYQQPDGTLVFAAITNRFEVHINNHGKTPARTHHVRIGFFDAAAPPPPDPPLGDFEPLVDAIGPGRQSLPIKAVDIEGNYARTAICGRFYWTDIWNREWSSGFVYEISAPESVSNGSISIITPSAYTEEREEKEKPWERPGT